MSSYRCENRVFFILLETGWSNCEKSEDKIGGMQNMNNFFADKFSHLEPPGEKNEKNSLTFRKMFIEKILFKLFFLY